MIYYYSDTWYGRVGEWFTYIFYNPIRRFIRDFKRACKWFVRGYKSYDWDYYYLYQVMDWKLSDMEKCIRNGNSLHRQSYGRMIKHIRWYIGQLLNGNDAFNKIDKLFHEKYGDISLDWINCYNTGDYIKFKKCKTKEDNEWANKVFMRIHSYDDYLNKKHKTKMLQALDRWMFYLWD